MKQLTRLLLVASAAGPLLMPTSGAFAQDKPAPQTVVVATVNGKALTENDLKLAEAEIGGDLGNLPAETRRRVLVEYLIENQLFAEAAEAEKLAGASDFDRRMQYWRRRALRDSYFDTTVRQGVTDAERKAFYESQVAGQGGGAQVRARHILVETQETANELFQKIAHGGDFAKLAKEFSKDPGSKQDGGDLGYFGRGQMVPQFEEAAFKLKTGEVSEPIKSQFGWHLIKLEDKRELKPPPFDSVKDRITAALMHQKAQEIAANLRNKAKIDYVDPAIKKQVEDQKTAAPAAATGAGEAKK